MDKSSPANYTDLQLTCHRYFKQRLAPACTVSNRIHDHHSDEKAQEVNWSAHPPRSHQDRPTLGARGNRHTLGSNHAIMQPVLEGNIQWQAIRHLVKSHKFLKNLDILNSFGRWLKYLIPSGLICIGAYNLATRWKQWRTTYPLRFRRGRNGEKITKENSYYDQSIS